MTGEFAADLVTWRYDEPYGTYSLVGVDPAFFTDAANGYVALVDDAEQLIGYRCFGSEGRVPGFGYDNTALDTGGGLRPALTGQGLGRQAIATRPIRRHDERAVVRRLCSQLSMRSVRTRHP